MTLKTADLGPAGRRLWRWLRRQFDGVDDLEPLALELCRLADRLHEVRARLAAPDLPALDFARLAGAEVRLSASFVRTWRALGLSDGDSPPARGRGRPSSFEETYGP